MGEGGFQDGTTPQPPPLKRRGSRSRDTKTPSSSEEGGGGGVAPTVAQATRDAATRLGTDWARDEAEMLMAHALGVTRSAMLLGHMRDPVPAVFPALLERRLAHEPIAYITGETEFYGLPFVVTPDVLIPRSDSETLIEAARTAFAARLAPRRILDLGTGSGALLLTLLTIWPEAEGLGLDSSANALLVAIRNAQRLANTTMAIVGPGSHAPPPHNPKAGVARFVQRDWVKRGWGAGLGTFDLVIANPPYVEDGADLDASVRDFEPARALFAGPEGLDAYRVLIPQLPGLLAPAGIAVLEIGWRQGDAVTGIARTAGFEVTLRRDLADRPRALILSQKSLANSP